MAGKNKLFTLRICLATFFIYQEIFRAGFLSEARKNFALPLTDDEDYHQSRHERIAPNNPARCANGWHRFGNKCYKYFGINYFETRNWASARSYCRNISSTLVSIHSREEVDFFSNLGITHKHVWIGLRQPSHKKPDVWDDGSPVDFLNWKVPMRRQRGEACALMVSYWEWIQTSCLSLHPFLCQSSIDTTDPDLEEGSGDRNENLCTAGTCQNGGICIEDLENINFNCTCLEGYKGIWCEEEITDIWIYIYIVGAVIGAISSTIIAVSVVLVLRSRKRKENKKSAKERDTAVTMSSCKAADDQD